MVSLLQYLNRRPRQTNRDRRRMLLRERRALIPLGCDWSSLWRRSAQGLVQAELLAASSEQHPARKPTQTNHWGIPNLRLTDYSPTPAGPPASWQALRTLAVVSRWGHLLPHLPWQELPAERIRVMA